MKLIMMIGIPGSGKSFKAKEVAKKENAIIVSSDEIRKELFGDENIQKEPRRVFDTLYKRVGELLKQKNNVIIDATNIKRKFRILALARFKNVEKEYYYIDTPLEVCIERDFSRDRQAGEFVINKCFKQLDFPLYGEGFNKINIIHTKKDYSITKKEFVELITKFPSYDELYNKLKSVNIFANIYKFDQETLYHKYLLCEHIYNVFNYINEYYSGEDKLLLQISALLHDVGKPICKKFKEEKGYYTYYGHDLTSSQIACHFLKEFGFDDEFILKVVFIIQMHMYINFGGPNAQSTIYHLIGEDLLSKLYILREADASAK